MASWLILDITLLVVEGVVSIHPDVFQSANRVCRILLSPGARLPPRSAELSTVSLDSGLATLTWHLNHC